MSGAAAEPFISAYPAAWGARVTVRTADGRQLAVDRAVCSGDPDEKLSESRLLEKADELLRMGGMSASEATRTRDSILSLVGNSRLNEALVPLLLSEA